MSKQRAINTKFWSDTWIREALNPLDRYVFLYLLTNEHTNISGIYELSLSQMAFETGLDKEELVRSMLPKLEPKVIYKNGWVILVNFPRHQNQKSPKIRTGIKVEVEKIPKDIYTIAIQYGYCIDTQSHLNPNLNLNPNPNLNLNLNPKNKRNSRFAPPSLQEISDYCKERGNKINPQAFLDFYLAKGWMIGKNKMKDWKAAVRTWENSTPKLENQKVFRADKPTTPEEIENRKTVLSQIREKLNFATTK